MLTLQPDKTTIFVGFMIAYYDEKKIIKKISTKPFYYETD